MVLKVKVNHCPLLDSKFKFSQLGVGSWRRNIKIQIQDFEGKPHHITLKVSSLPLAKLKRKINASKGERGLGFI